MENARELVYLSPVLFYFTFTDSQEASCKHFQCQNRRLRVFEAGYWKDYQNKQVISKEQAKTSSLIFSFK
jgi:hypothetical protein